MNTYVSHNINGTYDIHNVTQEDLNHLKTVLGRCVPITSQTYNLWASMCLFISADLPIMSNHLNLKLPSVAIEQETLNPYVH